MRAGRFSIVGVAFVSAACLITFSTSTDCVADGLPKGLPAWFHTLDRDEDGQISLGEWRQAGKGLDAFRRFDLDDDGLIAPNEILRVASEEAVLKLVYGRVHLDTDIYEATGEKFREKKTYRIFIIRLEEGKIYQIEEVSPDFYAYVYLEDTAGAIAAKNNSGGRNRVARIVHRAAKSGTYRIIATSQDGYKTGRFSLSVRIVRSLEPDASHELPSTLADLDADHDGQLALYEWRQAGKKVADFRKLDRDNDGFITPREVATSRRRPIALKFKHGRATYKGALNATDGRYLGKKTAKLFTLRLTAGKTYRIDHMSRAFDAYLYLDDTDGTILAQDDDGGQGTDSRIVHAAEGGTYTLVCTSLGGSGLGPFSLSVLDLSASDAALADELPAWFHALDTDNDGQVAAHEWKKARKNLAEFRQYDRDNDGFLTPKEVLRPRKSIALKLQKGEATYNGTIEATDLKYKGKKLAKILTVALRRADLSLRPHEQGVRRLPLSGKPRRRGVGSK